MASDHAALFEAFGSKNESPSRLVSNNFSNSDGNSRGGRIQIKSEFESVGGQPAISADGDLSINPHLPVNFNNWNLSPSLSLLIDGLRLDSPLQTGPLPDMTTLQQMHQLQSVQAQLQQLASIESQISAPKLQAATPSSAPSSGKPGKRMQFPPRVPIASGAGNSSSSPPRSPESAPASPDPSSEGDDSNLDSPEPGQAMRKQKRKTFKTGSCKTVIDCGKIDASGKRQMTMHSPYFEKTVDIYTAANDQQNRTLYRASALAGKFGCATNTIGMYLARRHGHDGIFQAASFRHKPTGRRSGLKSGGYFLTLEACQAFEEHFNEQARKRGKKVPSGSTESPNSTTKKLAPSSKGSSRDREAIKETKEPASPMEHKHQKKDKEPSIRVKKEPQSASPALQQSMLSSRAAAAAAAGIMPRRVQSAPQHMHQRQEMELDSSESGSELSSVASSASSSPTTTGSSLNEELDASMGVPNNGSNGNGNASSLLGSLLPPLSPMDVLQFNLAVNGLTGLSGLGGLGGLNLNGLSSLGSLNLSALMPALQQVQQQQQQQQQQSQQMQMPMQMQQPQQQPTHMRSGSGSALSAALGAASGSSSLSSLSSGVSSSSSSGSSAPGGNNSLQMLASSAAAGTGGALNEVEMSDAERQIFRSPTAPVSHLRIGSGSAPDFWADLSPHASQPVGMMIA